MNKEIINTSEAKHQRVLLQSDLWDLDVAGSQWRVQRVARPTGLASYQFFSPRCAAEAVVNVAESMGLPRVLPMDVYSVAKRLDFLNDAFGGTWVWAAAEAYCRLVAGVQWVNLPAGAEYIGKWLNCRSAVAVGMRWTEQDVRGGGWGNVLEPGGMSRGAHAMCFYGFEPGYAWRRVPVFGKRRVADVFLAENTNAVAPLTHVPVARMAADALEVVGLVRVDG